MGIRHKEVAFRWGKQTYVGKTHTVWNVPWHIRVRGDYRNIFMRMMLIVMNEKDSCQPPSQVVAQTWDVGAVSAELPPHCSFQCFFNVFGSWGPCFGPTFTLTFLCHSAGTCSLSPTWNVTACVGRLTLTQLCIHPKVKWLCSQTEICLCSLA